MPVYDTSEELLRKAIASVRSQLYGNWELCIADDASTAQHVKALLAEARAGAAHIKVTYRETKGHISLASNSALALATGEYVVLLDHEDELTEHALYLVVVELNAHPHVVLVYSDEDKITEYGVRHEPYFKPDWNPVGEPLGSLSHHHRPGSRRVPSKERLDRWDVRDCIRTSRL